ncbi:MAG: hypothetical protein IPP91_05840 [Betaproteobacteria bacterium]|nr:hypothetical protein [Betaproteobacteria bacterium]
MRRFFVFTLAAALLAGCGDISRRWRTGDVGKAMAKALREQGVAEIDLGTLTRFSWDELFVFAAPTPPREACRKLHLTKEECDKRITMTSIRADETLLVFRENGQIAHVEPVLREYGDFARSLQLMPFKREQANFLVTAGPRPPGAQTPLFLIPRYIVEQRQHAPRPGSGPFLFRPSSSAAAMPGGDQGRIEEPSPESAMPTMRQSNDRTEEPANEGERR